MTSPSQVLARVRPQFRAVAAAVVPSAERFAELDWASLEAIVEDALAARPAALRRQLVLFLRILDLLARLRHGRSLVNLDTSRRTALLASLQRAPILLLRRGFWGLRTLILIGYYGDETRARSTGYRASARGWEARA